MSMIRTERCNWIVRYTSGERINHWIVAILFVAAAASGLAMFHPSLYWLSGLFGGGPWTRILHPFIGVAMAVAFVLMAPRFWRRNLLAATDRQWLRQWRDVVTGREDRLPPAGQYNAGQKAIFWLVVVCMALLLVTGILFWRPWFAPYVPIGLVRVGTLVHSAVAVVLIIGIIVHVYAAIWVKGSVRAMTRGTVTDRWAEKHHPAWYRDVTKAP